MDLQIPPALRRAAQLFLVFLALLKPWFAFGQGTQSYVIRDQGRSRTFELASDELLFTRRGSEGREVARAVQAGVVGANVLSDFGSKALVKLPKPIDIQQATRGKLSATIGVPNVEVQPVLYQKNVARGEPSRRYVSRQVLVKLARGESVAQLVARAGADGTRATQLEGHAILVFANPWRALEATNRLQRAGTEADIMLERVLQRLSAPNDPFFLNQWHLRNTGQGGGTLGIDANVVNAWDVTRGNGVTIVIVDDSLQTTHPDLAPNTPPFNSGLHHDFRDGDNDPRPTDFDDRHGTAVAGVAAARQNNGLGTSGSAPEARLLGVRLIGSPVSDQDVADALRWEPGSEVASVSNNSWGYTGAPALRDIGIVMKDALRRAATEGRNGLGQVTVFANGNSQLDEDDGNYNTLSNSRYVAAIGALTNFGEQSFYSTPGANVLVSAPSNGGSLGIFTTDVTGNSGYNPIFPGEPADTNYTNSFGGTSSACPLTSGGTALILAANPALGWRDVHEILAQTARKIDVGDSGWADNEAGFHFNHKYGAGMIDLTAAVVRALDWNVLSAETSVTRSLAAPLIPASIPDSGTLTRPFDFSALQNLRVERVEVVARITHSHRSDLEIVLISPSGKESILAQRHSRPGSNSFDDDIDYDGAEGDGWSFTSTHHWGENSQGTWTLRVRDQVNGTTGTLESARVNLFGTPSTLQRIRFDVQRQSVIESAGTATIRVERVGATSGEVSVDVASAAASTGGAAIPGQDFVAVSQTLVFADGESFKDVAITIQDDAEPDGNKYVYFSLKNPVGASLGGRSLTRLDIVDDESNVITVVPGDRTIAEKDGFPAEFGTFVIARSKATNDSVTVVYNLVGSAQEGADYVVSGSATILPGETSSIIRITPIDDDSLEGTENIILTVAPDPAYAVGVPASAQLNLRDNDLPLIEIRAIENSASEQGPTPGKLRVSQKHPRTSLPLVSPTALTVNLAIGGSAQPGQNYVPIEDRTVIDANSDHVDIIVTPIDDNEYHPNQVVVIQLAPSDEYAFGFSTEDAVNIAENEAIPDAMRPTVTITAPASNAQILSPADRIELVGTAMDNQQVSRVTYQVNNGPVQIADGTSQWSANIIAEVIPGVNTVKVRSFDEFDNASDVVTRSFTYVRPHSLNVTVEFGGSITTGFTGATVQNAGITLSITAKPASKKFAFAGWTGDLEESAPTFTFSMPDKDTAITANFVANPFNSIVAGSYQGLIHAQPFDFNGAGFLQVTVTKTAAFSAMLTVGAVKYRIKGEFTADQPEPGKARFRTTLPRQDSSIPLLLDFILDLSPAGTHQLTGSVSPEDASFNAPIVAERSFYNKKSNPNLAQAFTMVFPAVETPSPVQPRGLGWGAGTIDAGGSVKWAGMLPDGSKASQATFLRKDNTWPLFLELYKKKGIMLGTVVLDEQQPDSDLNAQLDWFKPDTGEKLFPSRFTVTGLDLVGSRYVAPNHDRVLSGFDGTGTIAFREGFLRAGNNDQEFESALTLSTSNKFIVGDGNPHNVKISVSPGTGVFRGSFDHPQTFPLTRKPTPFTGVIFQRKQPGGAGQFIGELVTGATFQTGQVSITPSPTVPVP